MILGRYVDYTVGKQQAVDWVSILPYITSPHSSLCFLFFYFLLPSFFQITSHFPSFQGEVAGDASKVMRSNMMIGRHTTMEERRILKPGSSQCCNIMGKAKCRGGEVNTCNQADRKVKESTN